MGTGLSSQYIHLQFCHAYVCVCVCVCTQTGIYLVFVNICAVSVCVCVCVPVGGCVSVYLHVSGILCTLWWLVISTRTVSGGNGQYHRSSYSQELLILDLPTCI